jgi:beta-glucosidase
VTNSGDLPGQEVVQLYIRDQVSSVTRPIMELRGFKKIELAPGQSSTVTFTIDSELLSFFDKQMKWTTEPGRFTLFVGGSSRREDLQTVDLVVR